MSLREIGRIKHYFPKAGVAVVELTATLRVGNTIKIVSGGGSFTQEVSSMQVEHADITEARAGQLIGLKLEEQAKMGSRIFRLEVEREAGSPPIQIGRITHYFSKPGVAVIKLESPLRVGEMIKIAGREKTFTQEVESMQVDHAAIDLAQPGQTIGLKVKEKVHEGNRIYKIEVETEPASE